MDEKKRGTRRKRDDECENVKKLLKKLKNEEVAEGRIIGFAGPCSELRPKKTKEGKEKNVRMNHR